MSSETSQDRKKEIARDLHDIQLRHKTDFDVDSEEFQVLVDALKLYIKAIDVVAEGDTN